MCWWNIDNLCPHLDVLLVLAGGDGLPKDAALSDQQILPVPFDKTRIEVTFDFAVSVF